MSDMPRCPEHIAQLGVGPSLYGVVGARQRALRDELRLQLGEERSRATPAREQRSRHPKPLIHELVSPVDHARIIE